MRTNAHGYGGGSGVDVIMTQVDVRVRIAPSPTGVPHVGTAYIGLFNYVFARAHGGQFLVRIEDTDQTRSHRRYEEAILRSLRWIGLQWDEGPDVGGPYGPYRQSERLALYQRYAQELLAADAAYRCWCTPERLEAVRQQQRQQKHKLRYDGHCRTLTAADIAAQQAQPCVVRLKVQEGGTTVVHDAFRAPITFDHQQIDDQVLLKSDGYPTYHLANVVDDHLMRISHVIRAEEWLSSTPKHVLLYQAFGWEPPIFMHMPLLRNADRSKISKRKNPVSLNHYRRAGYLPEALLNYLALMGWGMPDGREEFTLDEFVASFTLERISLGGPVFDQEKLAWLNGKYMRRLTPAELLARLRGHLLSDEYILRVLPLVQDRIDTLEGFFDYAHFFFAGEVGYDDEALKQLVPRNRTAAEAAKALQVLLEGHVDPLLEWEAASIEAALRAFAEAAGWSAKEAFMAVRVAATGRVATPPLFETLAVLGKE